MVYKLPGRCTKVVIGVNFNFFLLKDQTVWASGSLKHNGEVQIDTSEHGTLVNLNDLLMESTGIEAKFVNIEAGYSHALLLDSEGQIYVYGSGFFGQLGLGAKADVARYPMPVSDVNDGLDKVRLIACGPNFNICYTEHGILYSWGMLVPDDYENIQWIPNFMPISFQKSLYEQDDTFLHEFHLTDIKATNREIVACDSKGHLYHSELLQN
jgi:alpha-tubulin suppressor-like RCC1 family protein